VIVDRGGGGLNDENVRLTHNFFDHHKNLTVRELPGGGLPQGDPQVVGYFLG
jgi:hypothetical protein